MLKFENVEIEGIKKAIYILRKTTNTLERSDSGICKGGVDGIGCKNCADEAFCNHSYDGSFQLGKRDYEYLIRYSGHADVHRGYKNRYADFLKTIFIFANIKASLRWWDEFEYYTLGDSIQSYTPLNVVYKDQDFDISDFKEPIEFGSPLTYDGFGINDLETFNKYKNWLIDKYKKEREHEFVSDEFINNELIHRIPSSFMHTRYVGINFYILKKTLLNFRNVKEGEWLDFINSLNEIKKYNRIIINNKDDYYFYI